MLSLLSVNGLKIFAGGIHSWVVLDDIMPKKDDFIAGGAGDMKDSPLNSNKEGGNGSAVQSQMDIGSNWNYQVMN